MAGGRSGCVEKEGGEGEKEEKDSSGEKLVKALANGFDEEVGIEGGIGN